MPAAVTIRASQPPVARLRPLRVVLVHDWLTGYRGGEKCLAVACELFPDARLLTLLRKPGATTAAIERMDIQTSWLQHLPGVTRYYRLLLPCMPSATRSWHVPPETDLVLSFSHAVAKSISVPPGVPHLCYCFTPMRYAWHLRNEYLRPSSLGGLRGWIQFGKQLLQRWLLERIRRWDAGQTAGVTQFLAASQTVAERIAECYGRTSEVLYPPVDTNFYTPADVRREDFYLCVSALVPYKRIDLAVAACQQLGKRLIVIGDGPERAKWQQAATAGISFLGYQSDEAIRDHYRRCQALLFPGEEDFGIVPLEAQACGAAVIALGKGGATETVVPFPASGGREPPELKPYTIETVSALHSSQFALNALKRGGLTPPARQKATGLWFASPTVPALVAAIQQFEQGPPISAAACRAQAERFAHAQFVAGLQAAIEQVLFGSERITDVARLLRTTEE